MIFWLRKIGAAVLVTGLLVGLSGCDMDADLQEVLVEEGASLGAEVTALAVVRNNPEFYDVVEVVAGFLEKATGEEDPETLRADVIQLVRGAIEDPEDEALAVLAVNRVGNIFRRVKVTVPEVQAERLRRLAQAIRDGALAGRLLAEEAALAKEAGE